MSELLPIGGACLAALTVAIVALLMAARWLTLDYDATKQGEDDAI